MQFCLLLTTLDIMSIYLKTSRILFWQQCEIYIYICFVLQEWISQIDILSRIGIRRNTNLGLIQSTLRFSKQQEFPRKC
jgi:hypothetical protein